MVNDAAEYVWFEQGDSHWIKRHEFGAPARELLGRSVSQSRFLERIGPVGGFGEEWPKAEQPVFQSAQ